MPHYLLKKVLFLVNLVDKCFLFTTYRYEKVLNCERYLNCVKIGEWILKLLRFLLHCMKVQRVAYLSICLYKFWSWFCGILLVFWCRTSCILRVFFWINLALTQIMASELIVSACYSKLCIESHRDEVNSTIYQVANFIRGIFAIVNHLISLIFHGKASEILSIMVLFFYGYSCQ